MRKPLDLSLMLVTDPAMTRRLGLVETVLAAVAGGVTVVQLRDKDSDDAALLETARALKASLDPLGVPLIVNDRPAVARTVGAAGLHIGQDDGDVASVRAIIGPDMILGLSVTGPHDLAAVEPRLVDYVGLGPVFASATKGDAAPPLGLDGLRAIGARLPVPFVAIGGIEATNAAAIMAAGAAGIAVVSAICAAVAPRAAAAMLSQAIDATHARRSA